jgi:hypothetical protein
MHRLSTDSCARYRARLLSDHPQLWKSNSASVAFCSAYVLGERIVGKPEVIALSRLVMVSAGLGVPTGTRGTGFGRQ